MSYTRQELIRFRARIDFVFDCAILGIRLALLVAGLVYLADDNWQAASAYFLLLIATRPRQIFGRPA